MAADEPPPDSKTKQASLGPNGKVSAGQLVAGIAEDLSTLVRKEVELAKAELNEIVRTKLRALAIGGIAVILAALVVPLLVLTLIEVLAIWLARWVAVLIVTVTIGAIAAVGFLITKKLISSKIVPEKTVQTLKEDVEWAKQLKT